MADEKVYEGEIVDDAAPADRATMVAAIDPLTRAEIDIQVATAKRWPRDLAEVKRDMIAMATLDEETAASCFYSLKRRDADGNEKIIQGPSIRLSEIALSCFGNIRAGTRSLGETEDGRFVKELGICHDVQKNVMVGREVKRRITTKRGQRYGDDMVGVTMAAAGSIALRNAILTVVPRALVKPAYDRAREVAVGKAKSLTVQRNAVIEKLSKLSPLITVEKILAAIGKPNVDAIGWDEVQHLIGLGTAIKDGIQTVEEAFPTPTAETRVEEVTGAANGAKAANGTAAPAVPLGEAMGSALRGLDEAHRQAAAQAEVDAGSQRGTSPQESPPGASGAPKFMPAGKVQALFKQAEKAGLPADRVPAVVAEVTGSGDLAQIPEGSEAKLVAAIRVAAGAK